MGKKKIQIKKIENPYAQTTTFSRRRNGLLKKAYELSVLCGVDITVLIFDTKNKCHIYCSDTAENAAQMMMEKYINKRFKTDTSKKHIGEVPASKSFSWNNTQESVSVVETYNVISSSTKENDGSQTYIPLEEGVDDIDEGESLCIRSKRTYYSHFSPSKLYDTQTSSLTSLNQTNTFNKNHVPVNSHNVNPSVFSERTYPYLNSSYEYAKSTPNFCLSSDSQNFYQDTTPLVQNDLIDGINQIDSCFDDKSYILKRYSDQPLRQSKVNSCIESDILNSFIEDYILPNHIQEYEKTIEERSPLDNKLEYSPSKILQNFQNYLYL
ncbi:hypothetical protein PORY_001859 [Pneumocystis oryctolagi]|uniref:Uncharacterized protein n=1 Tax=Pneumocystis oryctolagi TaxID=42067 RepID=A0ACB7CB20_9ASCO|nr:hypothetical protein PORY_001859 [Pneumocystis oryctolagi]